MQPSAHHPLHHAADSADDRLPQSCSSTAHPGTSGTHVGMGATETATMNAAQRPGSCAKSLGNAPELASPSNRWHGVLDDLQPDLGTHSASDVRPRSFVERSGMLNDPGANSAGDVCSPTLSFAERPMPHHRPNSTGSAFNKSPTPRASSAHTGSRTGGTAQGGAGSPAGSPGAAREASGRGIGIFQHGNRASHHDIGTLKGEFGTSEHGIGASEKISEPRGGRGGQDGLNTVDVFVRPYTAALQEYHERFSVAARQSAAAQQWVRSVRSPPGYVVGRKSPAARQPVIPHDVSSSVHASKGRGCSVVCSPGKLSPQQKQCFADSTKAVHCYQKVGLHVSPSGHRPHSAQETHAHIAREGSHKAAERFQLGLQSGRNLSENWLSAAPHSPNKLWATKSVNGGVGADKNSLLGVNVTVPYRPGSTMSYTSSNERAMLPLQHNAGASRI
jgi:hypothetical protein